MKTRLKDIVNIRTGYQFRGKVEPTTEASGIPFIQIKDVDPDFGLDPSDVFCVNVDIKTSRDKVIEKYGVQTGDVLFLSRARQKASQDRGKKHLQTNRSCRGISGRE